MDALINAWKQIIALATSSAFDHIMISIRGYVQGFIQDFSWGGVESVTQSYNKTLPFLGVWGHAPLPQEI